MALDLPSHFDRWAGRRIENANRRHHRRRMERIGQIEQVDPPRDGGLWVSGDPAPRDGCELEVLIDGEEALPRIAEALAGARSHVHIAGWHLTPDFGLTRDGDTRRLRDLLGELAERVEVRVLLWAGAPLPILPLGRGDVRDVRDELIRGTRIKCALDSNERPMHCHHEKIVIVDGEIAFVGGLDMTSLSGDRFDTGAHLMHNHIGWHDVASRLRGPAVADVAAHFASRWGEVVGEELDATPAPAPAGDLRLQVVRTVPEKIYDFLPMGDFRIVQAYVRALRSARQLIYLENQFLWSPTVVDILADKLRDPPSPDFRIVALLPAKPTSGADTTRGQLGVLAEADGGGGRFLATTISAMRGELSGPLYVHAKVAIVDDEWLTLGSANLNDHSFFNDSEMNVVTCDSGLARETRLRLWAEHLERSVEEVSGATARVVDELWRPIASEQRDRQQRGAARTHRLMELPGVSRRSMALLGPLYGLVVDG